MADICYRLLLPNSNSMPKPHCNPHFAATASTICSKNLCKFSRLEFAFDRAKYLSLVVISVGIQGCVRIFVLFIDPADLWEFAVINHPLRNLLPSALGMTLCRRPWAQLQVVQRNPFTSSSHIESRIIWIRSSLVLWIAMYIGQMSTAC